MPYKRRNPATMEEMNKKMKGDNTLCNVFREMYHIVGESEIGLKIRLAFSMGKAMCEKLAFYKEKHGFQIGEVKDGTWVEFREREPIDIQEMDKSRWEGHHSICQTLRDIYHMTENGEIQLKARVAMAMTKAMHEKLKSYKAMEAQNVNNGG